MEKELSNLRDIVSALTDKMDTWRVRHEVLARGKHASVNTLPLP